MVNIVEECGSTESHFSIYRFLCFIEGTDSQIFAAMKNSITIVENDDGKIELTITGFNNFEVVGLLTSYRDALVVDIVRGGIVAKREKLKTKKP